MYNDGGYGSRKRTSYISLTLLTLQRDNKNQMSRSYLPDQYSRHPFHICGHVYHSVASSRYDEFVLNWNQDKVILRDQYNESNVMHFLFSLLRIKGLS
jgi:hypothetical protein